MTAGVLAALLLAGCGGGDSGSDVTAAATGDAPTTLRLGYFPNVTHATALAGIEKGIYRDELGPDKVELQTFNAGPAAVEALFSDAVDAAYIGPNPAINAFVQSKGEAIRIVSGATSGGAALVVKPTINKPADLKGKKLASPQLGNTQDVALRFWLDSQGIETTKEGGGDASIVPQENGQTLETFKAGSIDGAWAPEPWATRLVQEGGGKVLVDEKSLWPDGQFVTTHLVVRTKFLRQHPGTVRRLIQAQVAATRFVNDSPAEAQRLANQAIEKVTGKKLADDVITAAWANLTFTDDPLASSLRQSAAHAEKVGLLGKVDLGGIYDLTLLNEILATAGKKAVEGT